jgi:hypothetical protein
MLQPIHLEFFEINKKSHSECVSDAIKHCVLFANLANSVHKLITRGPRYAKDVGDILCYGYMLP